MKRRVVKKRARPIPPALTIIFILLALVVILGLLVRADWMRRRAGREIENFFSSSWTEKLEVEEEGNRLTGVYDDYRIRFTLDRKIQELAVELLQHYEPVMGVFVAMDARTGAVLAMAAHNRRWKNCDSGTCPPVFLHPQIRNSDYPMASLVKIMAVAAALESKIVSPDTKRRCRGRESFPGGTVRDPGGLAHGNIAVGDALGFSCNAIFGRLGVEVGRERLEEYLDKFMIGRRLDFDLPLLESNYLIDDDELDIARAAAGFGDIRISPVHAAAVAAAVQNRGRMMRPYFIDGIERVREKGEPVRIYEKRQAMIARPVKKATAAAIAGMMRATVHKRGGTAYRGFYKRRGYIAGPFDVTGKTGSLNGRTSKEQFTWMIGFVEEGEPKFAFAALVLNDEKWTIKAASFTGQFFKHYAAELSR